MHRKTHIYIKNKDKLKLCQNQKSKLVECDMQEWNLYNHVPNLGAELISC